MAQTAHIGRYSNASLTIDWAPQTLPGGTTTESITLATPDRSATSGTLYCPQEATAAVVAISHPRVDMTRHYLIPVLLQRGIAVWAQRTRTVNNDVTAVHEQLLVDLAVAHVHLKERGFERLFVLGNSGGAGLYCFYIQQSSLAPEARLKAAPSGLAVDLGLAMPKPDGLILLAPHPGQGDLLLHNIDPSVADEADPTSSHPELDMFNPVNGFRQPPNSATYTPDFLTRYRAAQHERVSRLDSVMRDHLQRKKVLREAGRNGDVRAQRLALAPTFITVYRTDADPRTCDLSLDPSNRDYGSIFGYRPDITNFGAVGFCRLTTPEAWLSTWSGLSSKALLRLTAPSIMVPTLLVYCTADNSVFPDDIQTISRSIPSEDKALMEVDADHFGYIPGTTQRNQEAGLLITDWLEARS